MTESRTVVYLKMYKYAGDGDFSWIAPSVDTPNCDNGIEVPNSDIIGTEKIQAALSIVSEMSSTERFELLLRITGMTLSKGDSEKIFDSIIDKLKD